jgi:hypothetical protein
VVRRLSILPLFMLPFVVQAQFTFTTNNGAVTITGYTGPGGTVIIPSTTNGYPVTSIANSAFALCYTLSSVTVPDSVTSIGDDAFAGCYSLASVTLSKSLATIGNWAFEYCSSLSSLAVPDSVTSIGNYAFEFCTSLTSATIGSGVSSIGTDAFFCCTSLTGLYFKGNAPSVGSHMFDYDYGATIYFLPGTTNWTNPWQGRPTLLWDPQVRTKDGSFGVRTNRFGFTITGATNIPLIVEACTNLSSGSWTALQTCTLTNGSIYFSDPSWMNYPARFYRIRSP